MKTIKIYVVCHKPSFVPDNPLLVPVQAGAALSDTPLPGMIPDDTGDNISDKNPLYCELTPQYWAWKNDVADWYGFFHYRRYLSFQHIYTIHADGSRKGSPYQCPFKEFDDIRTMNWEKEGLTENRMRNVIRHFDLITVLRERIDTSVYHQFTQFHDKGALDAVLRILNRLYPEYVPDAKTYLASHDIYYMNMYIMKKDMFFTYMEWLFHILGTYAEEDAEKSAHTAETPRIMGFLAERLFGIFYTHQLRLGTRCAEVPYLRFYRTSPGGDPKELEGYFRTFSLGKRGGEIRIDMRKLDRLAPPGSRRRILMRRMLVH